MWLLARHEAMLDANADLESIKYSILGPSGRYEVGRSQATLTQLEIFRRKRAID